jgi:ribose 5-phosphate isomerase B
MRIYIGGDHAGYELKEKLKKYLTGLSHEVSDKGAHEASPHDDYPDFVMSVAREVAGDSEAMGIVLGKSGQGEAMCANRIKGARAAVFYGGTFDLVKLAREHNNANILSLGAGFITEDEAKFAVELFINTKFSGDERHVRRLAKFN